MFHISHSHWAVRWLAMAILLWCGVQPVTGQAAPQAEPASSQAVGSTADMKLDEQVTWGEAFFLKMRQGGITMIFLLGISIVAVATTLERIVNLRFSKIAPRQTADQIERLCRDGRIGDMEAAAAASNSTLGRVVTAMVRHRDSDIQSLSTLAGDVASREMKMHLLRAYPLMVCATLSPLLGLFGTVAGMIGAFDKVAAAGSLGDASMLGGNISMALITTAAGLVVAIPALGLYHFFRSRTSLMAIVLEERVGELITQWRRGSGDSQARRGGGNQ
jgi:biopolymer transport protein ExbB